MFGLDISKVLDGACVVCAFGEAPDEATSRIRLRADGSLTTVTCTSPY